MRFSFCPTVLILIGLSLNTRADVTDWFVELDGTNGFYASSGVPEPAITALKEAQNKNDEIKSFAFMPNGDWIILNDKSFEASDARLEMYKNLQDTYQRKELGKNINCVAITAAGSYINCYRHGLFGSGGNPPAAWDKYKDLGGSGHELRSLSYGPHESWVILYDKTNISYSGIPDDLAKVLDGAVSNNVPIECVAFSGTNWICLAHDEWWASDTNFPAAKIIGQNYKAGLHPKWIAFVPTWGMFDPHKFGTLLREATAGKVAGGYECVVIDHGKLVVALAEGWARTPEEKVNPAVKMTVNMQMDVASVSKTITAVAMLKFWEECAGTSRQFSLDEPFWPHISAICPNVNEDVKKITIRQLLAHLSGFDAERWEDKDTGHFLNDIKQFLPLPLANPPGTTYKYQGIDYRIIRLLTEQIGQVNYVTYVKTHVLAPMGITDIDSRYHDKPSMCCYAKAGSQNFGADVFHGDNSSGVCNGGWYGSAVDMGKFLEGIRQNRVLTPATTAMMFKENLGWDSANPWAKGGVAPAGNGQRIKTCITYCSDGVEAVMLMNCDAPCGGALNQALKDARY